MPFAKAFDECQSIVDFRFFVPTWWWIEKIFYWQSLKFSRNVSIIRDFAATILEKRRQESVQVYSDLLSFLLRLDHTQNQLSDERLIDAVLNFIIAGRDTTAQALSWSIYELCRHEKVQERLLKEIQDVVGSEPLTYDQIKEMKYANAVFQETLRLHPSVPKNIKEAVVDEVLPNGTPVPKGAMLVWLPYIMGRNTKIWGPDATTFNPDRWLTSKTYSSFEHPAFHGGPRICLGKNLAELEAVFVLVSLVRKYKISISDTFPIIYGNSLTLPMRYGLHCQVELR